MSSSLKAPTKVGNPPLAARLLAFLPGNRLLFKDSFGVLVGNLINMGMGMLTSIVLARTLPMAELGRYQLVVSYLALAQIAALPGMNVMVNKAAMKGHDALFYPILRRSMISAAIFSLLAMSAGAFLQLSGIRPDIGLNLLVVGAFLPIIGLEKHDPVFLGKKLFSLSRRMSVYSSLASFLLVGSVAYLTRDLRLVIAGLFAARLLTVGTGFLLARSRLSGASVPDAVRDDYLAQGWRQSWFTVFGIVVSQVDKLVLGTLNVQLLAVYYVGSVLPGRVKDNLKVLFGVTVTHWASLPKRENFLRIKAHWPKIALIGAGLSGLICLSAPLLIPLLYGKDYAPAVRIAQLLSLSLPVNMVSAFILNADIFQNRGNYFNAQSLVRQVAYLILLAALVPPYGYFGVIASILAAEFGSGIASIVYFLRELKRLSPTEPPL